MVKMNPRILIVHPAFEFFGGAELVIIRLCDFFRRMGIDHALLTTFMQSEIRVQFKETKIFEFRPRWKAGKRYVRLAVMIRNLRRLERNYDVLNFHNFPAEILALVSRKPSVWLCNEPEPHVSGVAMPSSKERLALKFWGIIDKFSVRNFLSKAIVADRFNQNRFMEIYNKNSEIIPYGIDFGYFAAGNGEKIRAEKNWENRFIILHSGGVHPLKNQLGSLEALVKISREIPDAMLIFMGKCEEFYKALLDKFIEENNLQGKVFFTGHVGPDEVRNYYKSCNVLLHPIFSVGGWLAPFEALSAGKPVIVSPQFTMADVIGEERLGVVTIDFAGTLKRLFQNPVEAVKLGSNGQKWVAENLSWEKFSRKMLDALRSVCEDKLEAPLK